jgi:hypothetical protein
VLLVHLCHLYRLELPHSDTRLGHARLKLGRLLLLRARALRILTAATAAVALAALAAAAALAGAVSSTRPIFRWRVAARAAP